MQAKFVDRQTEVGHVYSFFFSKPSGLVFDPGDYIELGLTYAPTGGRRWFSIASSPHEELLRITTGIPNQHSNFKQALNRLKIGQVVDISPAIGNFNMPINNDKLVFIAAGLGITPYRSMLLDPSHIKHNVKLIYISNPKHRLFEDELVKSNADIINIEKKPQFISHRDISRLVKDLESRMVYFAGSEEHMKNLFTEFLDIGHKRHRLRLSYFTGYNY